MTKLPHPWDAYARLQSELSKNSYIGNTSWGLEAALDNMLSSITDGKSFSEDDVKRLRATAERRERSRAALKRKYLEASDKGFNHEDQIHARIQLNTIKKKIVPHNWNALVNLGVGNSYKEVSSSTGMSSGNLRAHVFRVRQELSGINFH